MTILLLELSGILNFVINIFLLLLLTEFYYIHVYLLAFDLLRNWNYFVCIPLNLILLLSIIFLIFLHADSLSLLHSVLWSGYIIMCLFLLPNMTMWVVSNYLIVNDAALNILWHGSWSTGARDSVGLDTKNMWSKDYLHHPELVKNSLP